MPGVRSATGGDVAHVGRWLKVKAKGSFHPKQTPTRAGKARLLDRHGGEGTDDASEQR